MNAKEREWGAKASRFLKAELKRAGVGYKELAERLNRHGLEEPETSITGKLARGTFAASLPCLFGGIGDGGDQPRRPLRVMAKRLARLFLGASVIILMLAMIAWGATYSPSFQKCVADYGNNKSQDQTAPFHEKVVPSRQGQISVFVRCEGKFIDENNGTLVALATIALSIFTFTLWRSTERLWQSSEEHGRHLGSSVDAAKSVQRAYIVPRLEITPILTKTGMVDVYRVFVFLENNGTTSTRRAKWVAYIHQNAAVNPVLNEIDVSYDGTEEVSGNGFIAPRQSIPIHHSVITRAKMARIIKGERVCVVGRIDYVDIFMTPHITKFCFSIFGGPYAPTMTNKDIEALIDRFPLSYHTCRCNNCIDADCAEYAAIQQGASRNAMEF